MKYLKHLAAVSLMTSLLVGCGGGSSSSGASTPYAGQYDGTTTITLSGLGETLSQTNQLRVIVGVDGRVTAANPNGSASGQCNFNPKPVFLSGSSVTASTTYYCNIAGIGTCAFSAVATINFSNNAASVNGSLDILCPQGGVVGVETGYLRKTI